MDPKHNIGEQKRLAYEITSIMDRRERGETPSHALSLERVASLAEELAGKVVALDEWRGSGGFDPYGPARVAIAVWSDDEGMNAQAYATREDAERDYPGAGNPLWDGNGPEFVTIVDSTVEC